jgi:hypothetical protein
VRSHKAPAGQNRDRAYWEPAGRIARIEGHIEEIGQDSSAEAKPLSRLDRAREVVRDWRAQGLLVLGCLALIVGMVTVGPFGRQSGAPANPPSPPQSSTAVASGAEPSATDELPSPSPSAGASYTMAPWTPWPVATETPWQTQEPEPEPSFSTGGWPIQLEISTVRDATPLSVVGPDGTWFVEGYPAFDKVGHARSGWTTPDGIHVVPDAFGADGTAYALVQPDEFDSDVDQVDLVYAFDSVGRIRSGWPAKVDVADDWQLVPGPGGKLWVLQSTVGTSVSVTILGPQGQKLASWSFAAPGSDCGQVLTADGTLYYGYGPAFEADDCAIRVFNATGTLLSKAPTRDWNGLELAPDGSVVAWGYDLQPYASRTVAQTRIAVIGTDGQAAAGWPITITGGASRPAFGADGTMYVTVLGMGTSPSTLLALDPSGAAKPGWPIQLPAGFGPMMDDAGDPLPPVPGDNGVVYAPAVDRQDMGFVEAFDASGALLPGWPYKLPQAFATFATDADGFGDLNPGPMFVRAPSGSGLLYLVLDDRIVALDADGQPASGWPYVLSGQYADSQWVLCLPAPDGGLIAVATTSGTDSEGYPTDGWVAFRFTPAGKLPH